MSTLDENTTRANFFQRFQMKMMREFSIGQRIFKIIHVLAQLFEIVLKQLNIVLRILKCYAK